MTHPRIRTGDVIYLTVEGYSNFPCDMMRYDSCYPAREDCARDIERSWSDGADTREPLRITLAHVCQESGPWEPTERRWESFGWRVVGTSTSHTSSSARLR